MIQVNAKISANYQGVDPIISFAIHQIDLTDEKQVQEVIDWISNLSKKISILRRSELLDHQKQNNDEHLL